MLFEYFENDSNGVFIAFSTLMPLKQCLKKHIKTNSNSKFENMIYGMIISRQYNAAITQS